MNDDLTIFYETESQCISVMTNLTNWTFCKGLFRKKEGVFCRFGITSSPACSALVIEYYRVSDRCYRHVNDGIDSAD